MKKGNPLEVDVSVARAFKTQAEWRTWLTKNHATSNGLWLRIFKKNVSGEETVSYKEALDEALCFGWIDGQKKAYDADSWLQKFTPRTDRSLWSKVNREHVERLTHEGRMQPAGLAAVEAAKNDGRWGKAYDSPSTMSVPADFLKALAKNKKAKLFFDTLNRTNLYSIVWRLQTAKKPETRQKRMDAIIAMLSRSETFH